MNKTSYRNLIAKTKEIETYLHTHQTKTIEEIEDQIKHLEKMKMALSMVHFRQQIIQLHL